MGAGHLLRWSRARAEFIAASDEACFRRMKEDEGVSETIGVSLSPFLLPSNTMDDGIELNFATSSGSVAPRKKQGGRWTDR